jgi:hypothetical protein
MTSETKLHSRASQIPHGETNVIYGANRSRGLADRDVLVID